MLLIRGYYLDGKSAKRIDARLQLTDDSRLLLVADDSNLLSPLPINNHDICIEAPLGNTPREISLGQERLFISTDHDAVEQLCKLTSQSTFPFSLVHKLEANIVSVMMFTIAVLVFVWALAVHGIPYAAKAIAFEMPEYVEDKLSTGLAVLDNTILEPSQLSEARKNQINALFASHLEDHQVFNPHIHFRSGMEANALTLPNGDIVFTDALINLVGNDQELLAVLFHELGHLKHKHTTRSILQDSMITILTVLLTGDIDADLMIGLPTLLGNLAYSRAFELEADRYALDMLQKADIPVASFSNIIRRLASIHNDDGKQGSKIINLLSTHANAMERIQQAEKYQTEVSNK